MPKAYQAVQAGHCVAEWLLKGPKTEWNNHTLIYLNVPDEDELEKWGDKLTQKGIHWISFREPDLGSQLTAIASENDGRVFSNLPLLK